jgi:hypothetical protein
MIYDRKKDMHILRERDRAWYWQALHQEGWHDIQLLFDEVPEEPAQAETHPEAGQMVEELPEMR